MSWARRRGRRSGINRGAGECDRARSHLCACGSNSQSSTANDRLGTCTSRSSHRRLCNAPPRTSASRSVKVTDEGERTTENFPPEVQQQHLPRLISRRISRLFFDPSGPASAGSARPASPVSQSSLSGDETPHRFHPETTAAPPQNDRPPTRCASWKTSTTKR